MYSHLLRVYAFFLFASSLSAQDNVGPAPQPSNCLTHDQHESLIHDIKLASRIDQQRQQHKTTKAIILFDWPVRVKPSLEFYNYYCVTNYVDHDPNVGPGSFNQFGSTNLDYNCGAVTYDQSNGYNHQGTDIALWPFAWYMMDNDLVEVIAAQSGTILINEDGNFDENCGSAPTGSTANRIVIQHADNSRSIYLHLKNGSLTSKPVGSTVSKGEYLGVVGSSGFSSAPHLHFEVVDENFNLIDPYWGTCNSLNNSSWWSNQPAYNEPQINAMLTHSPWPVLNQCPASLETLNTTNCYVEGERLRLGIYYRDMILNMNTTIIVRDPTNNILTTASHSGIGTYPCYWWTFDLGQLPSGGPYGNWTIESSFNGQVYTRGFHYAASQSTSICNENCEDYIVESGNMLITQNAAANISISTNGTVASGISVDYQAGFSLEFLDGFNVSQGAVFHGYIAPCN